eukprot:5392125-Amphidinium_carterae.1
MGNELAPKVTNEKDKRNMPPLAAKSFGASSLILPVHAEQEVALKSDFGVVKVWENSHDILEDS